MRIAVIGTNVISDEFMSAAMLHKEFVLAAVCGSSIAKAQAFANKYGGAQAVDDYRKLAEIEGVEGVYIAAPNELHCPMSTYLLEQGIPVLCEKPLAPTLSQVRQMVETATAHNTLLLEGIMPLYLPNFDVIRSSLPAIGKVRKAMLNYCQYSRRYDNYRNGVVENAFRLEKMGGSMLDIGIYPLYQAISLFGAPRSVMATATLLETGVDGSGAVVLGYSDKEVVLLHSKITATTLPSEIQGEDGSIVYTGGSTPLTVELRPRKGETRDITCQQLPQRIYYELDEFINCFRSGSTQPHTVPYSLMLEVYSVAQEIRRQTGVVFDCDK